MIKVSELEKQAANTPPLMPVMLSTVEVVALARLARAAKEVLRVTDAVAAEDMYMHPTEEDEALREALSAFDFTD